SGRPPSASSGLCNRPSLEDPGLPGERLTSEGPISPNLSRRPPGRPVFYLLAPRDPRPSARPVARLLFSYALGLFAPYLLRLRFRPCTPTASRVPLTMWYRTPGRSFTRPPRISTIECSWRLCPTPGMYAVTSIPLVSRTLATFRRAEFGFFGVEVNTRTQTPRFCGLPWSAGLSVFDFRFSRPTRT